MKHGSSLNRLPMPERYWIRIDKRGPDECWPWNGTTTPQGYGFFFMDRKKIFATRYSWMVANNAPWPEGKFALHRCDNPACVNPNHIWPGTLKENAQDCLAKGRWGKTFGYRPRPRRKPLNTHCKRGHSFAEQKPFPPSKQRVCRVCIRECGRAFKAKKRAELRAQRGEA